MKKSIVLLMTLVMTMTMIAGCNKKEETPVEAAQPTDQVAEAKEAEKKESKETNNEEKVLTFKVGAYAHEYEEEFADGIETFTDYIYFKEDGTGINIAQDDIAFKWADGKIDSDSGSTYTYELVSDDTIEVTMDDMTIEYKYIGKDLPEEVVDNMRLFLDGTPKVNDLEAGWAFEDLITSDTISFYSSTSSVEYAAQGDDLSGMSAAYIEMTDEFIPVLLVRTPNAPDEVGKEHALQYLDGKIYNIVGLDKIEAVYKNAAVIVGLLKDADAEYVYYFKPDENKELYIFALKSTTDGNTAYGMCDSDGSLSEVTEDEFNSSVDEVINGDTKIEEIEWKSLEKTF